LQYRFASSRAEQIAPVACVWLIGTERNPAQRRIETRAAPNAKHQFQLPPIARAAGAPLLIEFVNAEERTPATVLFRPGPAPELLVAAGGFEMNFIRVLLLTMARLAFYSALGLTVGALFSFPVAAFVSLAVLLMTFCDSLIAEMLAERAALAGIPASSSGWHALFRAVLAGLHAVLPQLSRLEAFAALAEGRAVPWRLVLRAFGLLIGLYGSGLALLGAWLFSRREKGLPDA
jgi:hypothetical protein